MSGPRALADQAQGDLLFWVLRYREVFPGRTEGGSERGDDPGTA